LKVLGRRADGYHDLLSLMARLKLADELILTPLGAAGDELTFEKGGSDPQDAGLNVNLDEGFVQDNLVLKAISALRAEKPELGFWRVHINKKIPLAAGLGGGSSDAAAIIKELGRRAGLEKPRLKTLALNLGSDLPFFLGPPLALAEGRGEILSPWAGEPPRHVILVNPGLPLATGRVFQELALTKQSDENNLWPTNRLGSNFPALGENDLLAPALRLAPQLKSVSAALAGLGGLAHGLSGSGPTFWALFQDAAAASRALASLSGQSWWSTRTELDLGHLARD
jgi:4-diphosphocytidyl-2-C-methyl-D-erythritol kinase